MTITIVRFFLSEDYTQRLNPFTDVGKTVFHSVKSYLPPQNKKVIRNDYVALY